MQALLLQTQAQLSALHTQWIGMEPGNATTPSRIEYKRLVLALGKASMKLQQSLGLLTTQVHVRLSVVPEKQLGTVVAHAYRASLRQFQRAELGVKVAIHDGRILQEELRTCLSGDA